MSTVARKTPSAGSVGLFRLKEPFVCRPDVRYRVLSLGSFSDYRRRERDPYDLFYLPKGIGFEKFVTDEQAGALIVAIEDTSGNVIEVPDTYIDALPSGDEVPYKSVVIGIDLGNFPSDFDESVVIAEVELLLRHMLGTTPKVAVSTYSAGALTKEESIIAEGSRQAAITITDSVHDRLASAVRTADKLREYIAELEQVIATNG